MLGEFIDVCNTGQGWVGPENKEIAEPLDKLQCRADSCTGDILRRLPQILQPVIGVGSPLQLVLKLLLDDLFVLLDLLEFGRA